MDKLVIGEKLSPKIDTTKDRVKESKAYEKLVEIKEWRKILSDSYVVDPPFELDGQLWDSVENYYRASHFFITKPELSLGFVHGKASKNDTENQKKYDKLVESGVGDPNFLTRIVMDLPYNEWVRYRAQVAKFFSNELAQLTLLYTGDSMIWNDSNYRFSTMENIRECMKILGINRIINLSKDLEDKKIRGVLEKEQSLIKKVLDTSIWFPKELKQEIAGYLCKTKVVPKKDILDLYKNNNLNFWNELCFYAKTDMHIALLEDNETQWVDKYFTENDLSISNISSLASIVRTPRGVKLLESAINQVASKLTKKQFNDLQRNVLSELCSNGNRAIIPLLKKYTESIKPINWINLMRSNKYIFETGYGWDDKFLYEKAKTKGGDSYYYYNPRYTTSAFEKILEKKNKNYDKLPSTAYESLATNPSQKAFVLIRKLLNDPKFKESAYFNDFIDKLATNNNIESRKLFLDYSDHFFYYHLYDLFYRDDLLASELKERNERKGGIRVNSGNVEVKLQYEDIYDLVETKQGDVASRVMSSYSKYCINPRVEVLNRYVEFNGITIDILMNLSDNWVKTKSHELLSFVVSVLPRLNNIDRLRIRLMFDIDISEVDKVCTQQNINKLTQVL